MEKVLVRVLRRPILKTAVGDTVEVSRRDADILSRLGRVEIIPPAEDVEFTPSEKLEESIEKPVRKSALSTPEAPLKNVAHVEEKPKKRRRTRKKAK